MAKTKEQAAAELARLASLTAEQAKQVVDAVEQGIRDEAFDTIAGTGPVPSAMTDARAARLQYIARRLGRPLRRREVEVVFRIPSSTARAVVSRMQATYPSLFDETALLAAVRPAAHPVDLGESPPKSGRRRYRISFDDDVSWNCAYSVLNLRGLTEDVRFDAAGLTIELPHRMGPKRQDPLSVLGIKDKL